MSSIDPRSDRLRAFDAHAAAFVAASARGIEQGARLAGDDIARLSNLATALAASLADWGARIDRLDLGRRLPFNTARAADLLLESLFDEQLTPDAWRVLAAALDLAGTPE